MRPGLSGLALALLCLLGLSLTATAQQAPEPPQQLQIGVVSTEGATRTLEAWAPTAAFLNRTAAAQDLPYRFAIAPQTLASMTQAVEEGRLDFTLSDPASYVAAEVESGARALLSVGKHWQGHTYDATGALIFARADSPLRDIRQLEGRRVMAVERGDFGGWWLAAQEFRKRRMDPDSALSELIFSGGNQREVVYAVQSGLVDAGVIRAGLLEELAAAGAIDLDDFAPVSALPAEGYPFWVSTPLYPQWVLSALPDVPEPVLAMVINALLTLDVAGPEATAAGGVVWLAPQNYQPVHDLLISLRVRPYENYLLQAANRIFRSYRAPIVGGMALILLSLLFLAYELRRNIRLAEARRNVLQSEVRSKIFYRNAIEDHTVFCMLTQDGVISHVNDRFCTTIDRRRQGLLSHRLSDLLGAGDRDLLMGDIMAAMKAGAPWNGALTLLREDGSSAFVQCTCIPVTGSGDALSEIAVVATDVTQTRKGISEERFNDTLELIEDQVLVLRPASLEILYCNQAAQEMIRPRVGDRWKGRRVGEFIPAEELRALEMRRDALVEGPERRITWEVTTRSGTPYEISLEYVRPDQDEPRLVAIYRDITQRKVAEKAKTEFISTVSHELRTPLTSMKGALGLAMSGSIGDMSDPVKKMVSMASTNCDRLVMLINDILDLEKIEAGKMDFKMEPLDLADLVAAAIEANSFYADKFGVTLRAEIDGEPGTLMTLGDRNRLMQVMDNLLSNASKFSHKGSEVVIRLQPHRGALRLSVRDFGTGIPKAAQPTIFDKFTQADSSDTRSKGGTGLGLSIVRLIVEEHEGAIFFASEVDMGTEFFVDLPRLEGDALIAVDRTEAESQAAAFSDIAAPPLREEELADSFLQLVALLRQRGARVSIESARVTAGQVIKGVGVLGQSSALMWLSEQGRSLLASLCEADVLENRPVSVVEASGKGGVEVEGMLRPVGQADLLSEWLEQQRQDNLLRVMQIEGETGALPPREGVVIARVASTAQALSLVREDRFDLMMFGEFSGDTWVSVLMPLAGGRMAADMPITVIAARGAEVEASRGVVSKFARPAAGSARGKARRWAGRS
ncbi:PhnD/SsuA/transferrin family substrate-binding protein [Pseudodonghicola sp. IC7]|uniref:histidine kinase n=2 Tax=Pseudodonghicola flavimaris TaxID=3050036 RepID=A0ABT7EWL6_9RHOB|nr:PhnD/SsuA/transferrin family substrate-binding protein [Pseudodonghicola flavimaris]